MEQGTPDHFVNYPRANFVNSRSMEFCRRWGIAQRVRDVATPPDYPHTAMYVTSMNGYEIARIERPDHGGDATVPYSPEAAQRCNQIWFDPVVRAFAQSQESATLRFECRLDSFEQDADGVTAKIVDVRSGKGETVRARYLIDCCGGSSPIRKALGIRLDGQPVLGRPTSIYFRTKDIWRYHDKGKGVLHFIVGPRGVWATFNSLNGGDFWRVTLHGLGENVDPDSIDADAFLKKMMGVDFPHEILSITSWTRRELVAAQYRAGRVFLAGDAAHQNTPTGGFGMNTGLGDAVDLGWKLAADLAGWGGPQLLESYDIERRPVGARNVRQAAANYRSRAFEDLSAIEDDTQEGEQIRSALHDIIVNDVGNELISDGIAMGYCYDPSPICCPDGAERPPDSATEYVQTSYPGSRAPHAWLRDGRSTLDLFGRGFVLLRFGPEASDTNPLAEAAKARGVPFETVTIDEPEIMALYERKLVLVRPDGHVAWRSEVAPDDSAAVIDRVRGAGPSPS